MITCLHGMSPRRQHPPGATYELAKTVQTTGATSLCKTFILRKCSPIT
jgi:hypothetical protein